MLPHFLFIINCEQNLSPSSSINTSSEFLNCVELRSAELKSANVVSAFCSPVRFSIVDVQHKSDITEALTTSS